MFHNNSDGKKLTRYAVGIVGKGGGVVNSSGVEVSRLVIAVVRRGHLLS